jgi:hypothetical protein
MRATPILLAACAAALSAVPAGATAQEAGASSSCAGAPLLGLVRGDGRHDRDLAGLDRRTLLPRRSLRVPLPSGVFGWSWDLSPDCGSLAVAGPRGRVVLVDLERGRRAGSVSTGSRSAAGPISWPRPDRLVAVAGPYRSPRLVTVSVPDGRILASHRVGGNATVAEPTSLGLAVLSSPTRRIGSPTLLLADPDGGLLRVPLTGIRAGFDPGGPPHHLGRQIAPGLAVDEVGRRAYVVAANEPLVAAVDLATGVVEYHALRGGSGGAARPMASKGLTYGAYRMARWVGDGTIAVAGEVTRTRRDWRRALRRGQLPTQIDPYGLRLISVADWSERTLHPLLRWFTFTGDTVVGMDSVPVTRTDSRVTGLVAWRADGRRRFTRFRDERRAGVSGAAWPYAYVTVRRGPRTTHVVDLRTGRTVHEIVRRPPLLLVR